MKKLKDGSYKVTLSINPHYGRAIEDNWERWGTHLGPDDYISGILNMALMGVVAQLEKDRGKYYGPTPDVQGEEDGLPF